MAHDGQARRARQHHADLPAFPRPGAEPGRERLAVSSPELALKHRLRKLRRDRRRRMRGLAKAHRSTRNNHLHRNARLGSRRSDAMTVGISCRDPFATQMFATRSPRLRLAATGRSRGVADAGEGTSASDAGSWAAGHKGSRRAAAKYAFGMHRRRPLPRLTGLSIWAAWVLSAGRKRRTALST